MADSYREKVKQLKDELNNAEASLSAETSPNYIIWGCAILIPVIIGVILYYFQPGFVKNKEDGKETKSNGKVLAYTLIASILLWAGLYFYTVTYGSHV